MFQSRNLELSLCRRWYLNYDGMNFECHSDNWYIPKQGSARYWFDQSKKKKPNNFTNKLDVVTHFQNKCAETNGINWRTAINWIHNIAWPLSIFIYTVHYGSLGMELKFGIAGDKWSMDVHTVCISILVHGYLLRVWYWQDLIRQIVIPWRGNIAAIAGSLNLMNYSMGRWDPVIACRKWYDWWKTT